MILTLAKTFLGKYAVILSIVSILALAGGALVWMQKWADQKCTASINEAIVEAEEKAKEERQRITEDFLREQRGYEARLRIIRSQIDDVANDNPECIQPVGVVRLLNNALPGGTEPTGDIISAPGTDDTNTGGTPITE